MYRKYMHVERNCHIRYARHPDRIYGAVFRILYIKHTADTTFTNGSLSLTPCPQIRLAHLYSDILFEVTYLGLQIPLARP